MTIAVSKVTKQRTRQLGYTKYSSLFREVYLDELEDIEPKAGRALPTSLWFVHDQTLYEFLTSDTYVEKNYRSLLRLKKKHPQFKIYVYSKKKDVFLRFVEECRRAKFGAQDAIGGIRERAKIILDSISDMNLKPYILETSKEVVDMTIKAVFEYPKLVTLFTDLLKVDNKCLDHSVAVSVVATAIAKHMGFHDKTLSAIALGGLLHDIGLFKIPSRLLQSDEELNGDDMETYKTHVVYGQEMLDRLQHSGMKIPREVEIITMQHHEKFNGQGYPNRKRGRQEEVGPSGIHCYARIVAVADQYAEYIEEGKRQGKTPAQFQLLSRMLKQDGSFDPFILKKLKNLIKVEMEEA